MRYKLTVCYDGTAYSGWQIQKNACSVQAILTEALEKLCGQKVTVTASGRTDAGVHALGQVCHFDAQLTIPPERIADALNILLPCDISVLSSSLAEDSFDANRSTKRKTYRYALYVSPRRNPLKDRYAVCIKQNLDMQKLAEVAKLFEGEHDFKAYCASRSQVKTTVRTVYEVKIECGNSFESDDIFITVTGNGFLYNMVRTMVGTMLYYALGRLSFEDIMRSIEFQERAKVGKTMPPQGLTLLKVEYC